MLDKNDTPMTALSNNETLKQIQWLETYGQFNTMVDAEGKTIFRAKSKLQAAYLTPLGGALTISVEGEWHYLLNRDSLSLDQGETSLDTFSIIGEDGTHHELRFNLQGGDVYPFIAKAHYFEDEEEVLKEEVIKEVEEESTSLEEDDFCVEDAMQEAQVQVEEKTSLEQEEPIAKSLDEETSYEEEAQASVENILEEEMQSRVEDTLEEASTAQEIPKIDAEEVTVDEDSIVEAVKAPVEVAVAEVDEEQMLAKVHELMLEKKEEARLQAQDEEAQRLKEEEQRAKALELQAIKEEEQRIIDKEAKEKAAVEAMGGDEMLLKIQALMNAPKQLDIAQIEIVGVDKKVKKKEPKDAEETSKKKEALLQKVIKEEPKKNGLNGHLVLDKAEGTEIFKSSSYLEHFTLEPQGRYHFEPHEISYDYLKENDEEVSQVEISVTRSNGTKLIGSLTLRVQRLKGSLNLQAHQEAFIKDKKVHNEDFEEMSLEALAGSDEEFSHHSQIEEDANTPIEGHLAVVFDSLQEGDSLHSDGTLGITILLPTGAQAGETIIVNGSEFIITGPEADAGTLLYSVYPDDEVEVSYRDNDNNISDSIRAQANHQSVEMLEFIKAAEIMGEVGSQSVHAGLGESPYEGKSWGLMNSSLEVVFSIDSEFAHLKIDHETGELEYRYYENSGLNKYGKSADTMVCEKFIIALGNEAYAELEVNLHIQVQSIHGYSGQEIDSTIVEEVKLLKYDPSMAQPSKKDSVKDKAVLEMLKAGLASNKAKISKVMLEIYEAKAAGVDTSSAKAKLQSLTDKKTHLEDKLNSLKQEK